MDYKPQKFKMENATKALIKGISIAVFCIDITVLIAILVILWTMPDDKSILLSDYLREEFESELKMNMATDVKPTIPADYKGPTDFNLKPMAHFTGSKIDYQNDMDSKMAPIRKWILGNNCFLQNGMDYRNGRLVVPIAGQYYLYFFIDLLKDYYKDKSSQNESTSIEIGLFKTNILKPEEKELFCTCRPYMMSQNHRFTLYESYAGADVELEAGDEVYVKVSNISYVKNPASNVFGLYML